MTILVELVHPVTSRQLLGWLVAAGATSLTVLCPYIQIQKSYLSFPPKTIHALCLLRSLFTWLVFFIRTLGILSNPLSERYARATRLWLLEFRFSLFFLVFCIFTFIWFYFIARAPCRLEVAAIHREKPPRSALREPLISPGVCEKVRQRDRAYTVCTARIRGIHGCLSPACGHTAASRARAKRHAE